jgi:hypothetical protein
MESGAGALVWRPRLGTSEAKARDDLQAYATALHFVQSKLELRPKNGPAAKSRTCGTFFREPKGSRFHPHAVALRFIQGELKAATHNILDWHTDSGIPGRI